MTDSRSSSATATSGATPRISLPWRDVLRGTWAVRHLRFGSRYVRSVKSFPAGTCCRGSTWAHRKASETGMPVSMSTCPQVSSNSRGPAADSEPLAVTIRRPKRSAAAWVKSANLLRGRGAGCSPTFQDVQDGVDLWTRPRTEPAPSESGSQFGIGCALPSLECAGLVPEATLATSSTSCSLGLQGSADGSPHEKNHRPSLKSSSLHR
jgi:hypothetical protein